MKLNHTLLALSVGFCLHGAQAIAQDSFELTVAHVNDTHSAFDAVKSSFKVNEELVYNEFGGYPRVYQESLAYKQQAKDANDSFLFLHGGDTFQGSAYFKLNHGAMNADLLNKMGIDAMAMGNHEFDLGTEKLAEFVSSINFPMLAANIDIEGDEYLNGNKNIQPYLIYQFDGNKKTQITDMATIKSGDNLVGVIGLALDDMKDIASKTGGVEFSDMVISAQASVDKLKAMGITKVVAVTHIGNAKDVELASKVNGIDLIVGGHSHTLLGDFTNLGKADNGTYANLVANPDGGKTCIVQAGESAQAIGLVKANFNDQGAITSCNGHNTLLSNDEFYGDKYRTNKLAAKETKKVETFIDNTKNITITEENSELRKLIDQKYQPHLNEAYGDVITFVPDTINHERRPNDGGTDAHGSDVAPIVAWGQYAWAASDEVAKVAGIKADLSLVGAGGVRQDIAFGDLREGNISLELLPFSNALSIVPMSGENIKALISSSITATLPEGAHAGKFPYGGNLRYTFDETISGVEGKLSSIEINTGTPSSPKWTAVQDKETYNVAMDAYHATGNDGWGIVFDSQTEKSGRVDLAYVDGNLTAFPVTKLELKEKMKKGKMVMRKSVVYQGQALNCKAENVKCNTDAQSVVETLTPLKSLTPLSYETVTFNRAK